MSKLPWDEPMFIFVVAVLAFSIAMVVDAILGYL